MTNSSSCGVVDSIVNRIKDVWKGHRKPLAIFISPARMAVLRDELIKWGFPAVMPLRICGADILADREVIGIEIISVRPQLAAS